MDFIWCLTFHWFNDRKKNRIHDVFTQHYVDGAVSDNHPRCQLKNTITISAYAGESDLCPPRGSMISFHQVRFNNVSIQVNSENMYRVTSTFFPPEPQVRHPGPGHAAFPEDKTNLEILSI